MVDSDGIREVGHVDRQQHISDLVETADAVALVAFTVYPAGVQFGRFGNGSLDGLTQVEGVDGAKEASVEDVRVAAMLEFLRHYSWGSG